MRARKPPVRAAFAASPFCPRLCVFECLRLFDPDHTKRSCQIIVRTGGKEELIRTAVIRRSSSELNSPELVDDDILAVHIPDRAHKLSVDEIKGIDVAVVRIFWNQQSIAQTPKRLGCN